jgi:hypothetical protein
MTGVAEEDANEWAPDYEIQYMDSYRTLNKFYSLSASVRYSGAGGGASASAAIVRNTKLESRSVILAVRLRATTGLRYFKEATLSPAARAEHLQGMPVFSNVFGDTYIRSLSYGGEIAAVLSIQADSRQELEDIRLKASANGFGAAGHAATVNRIEELARTYKVQVKYCQRGGSNGMGAETDIVVLTAPELLVRMAEFSRELANTDSLKGAVVPLEMETWDMQQSLDWPGGDPSRPYPPAVESIAESLTVLLDKQEASAAVVADPAGRSPATLEAAHLAVEYLDYTLQSASAELRAIIQTQEAQATLLLESLRQYQLRRLLEVPPGRHANAGPHWEANTFDKAQLLQGLFGPQEFPNLVPWPAFELKTTYGYRGEDVGAYAGLHWRCHKRENHTEQSVVWPWAGKKSADDGVFVQYLHHGTSYRSGGNCGYTPMFFVALKFLTPEQPQVRAPARLPGKGTGRPAEPARELKPAKKLIDGSWEFEFQVDPGTEKKSAAAYEIIVRESSREFTRESKLPRSYWVADKAGPLRIRHNYAPDKDWEPTSWDVALGPVYDLTEYPSPEAQ